MSTHAVPASPMPADKSVTALDHSLAASPAPLTSSLLASTTDPSVMLATAALWITSDDSPSSN
eukprot:2732897-Amphidinium_carterae.1